MAHNPVLVRAREALERNWFHCLLADSCAEAVVQAAALIPADSLCSFGGSMSVAQSGIKKLVMERNPVLDPYDPALDEAGRLDVRRRAFACDWYLSGSNAITEDGTLVNLDAYGNRVGAICYGPAHVLIVAGRNKLVPDLVAAEARLRTHAAPANNKRLGRKTPCTLTGICEDCDSPERICNYFQIVRKSCPRGRITVLLVDEELGL